MVCFKIVHHSQLLQNFLRNMIFNTGERIRDLRTAAGLSQEQLAELASLNRVTVAKYEAGRVEPGAQALSRIADALGVSADVILGRAEAVPEENGRPRTVESRIISAGVDRMPPEDRKRALNVLRAACDGYFDEKDEEKMA